MKSVRDKVDFVTTLVGAGELNGVVNITFGTLLLTPTVEKTEPDLAISCRLRMPVPCARELRDALNRMFEETPVSPEAALNGAGMIPASEKPN